MPDSTSVPHIDGLFDLACRSGVDIRPTLLRVLTDIFVQKSAHSADEVAQYAELANRLLDHVDDGTRQIIAKRLSGHPDTPPAVAARLGIKIAASRVEHEPSPSERNELLEAFFAADAYERRLMLTNLVPTRKSHSSRPPLQAHETCRRLEAAALSGNIDEFTAILGGALFLPHAVAIRITQDGFGEPIVIAARALGMPAEILQRVLLFLNPAVGQSVARVYELAALYEEVNVDTAESMIAIWRGRPAAPRPNYQPLLHNDMQRSARSAASTSSYRVTRQPDAAAGRFKGTGR